jgi:hypothetical protein
LSVVLLFIVFLKGLSHDIDLAFVVSFRPNRGRGIFLIFRCSYFL